MGYRYASGRNALAICDVCGFQYKLLELRTVIRKGKDTNIKACPDCWDPDHPQLKLGDTPVYDPQAIRDPRPDNTQLAASRAIFVPVRGVSTRALTGSVTVSV